MKILVCGADGFLGGHIVAALTERGHQVVRGVRRTRLADDIAIDYRTDTTAETWIPRLTGMDVVINAVGIIRETQPGDFERIHHRAPAAMFEACRSLRVRRVIQISALGTAATPYLLSKRRADEALCRLLPQGVVLRPGLVFGVDGASTRFFLALASIPIQAAVRGAGEVQPVHVTDVAEAVARLIEGGEPGRVMDLPGPRRLSYREWMTAYRAGLGLAPAAVVAIPASLMTSVARLGGMMRNSLLSADTWAMLRAGNTGDVAAAEALLGRPLRAPEQFMSRQDAGLLRLRALAQWRRLLLRGVLAVIWFATAIVSAGIFPVEDSLDLLAPFGLTGSAALAVLAAATVIDVAMGLFTLWRPCRQLWQAQLALITGYSLLVSWRLSAFLIHPFGPILKNLAVAALLIQLWAEEEAS